MLSFLGHVGSLSVTCWPRGFLGSSFSQLPNVLIYLNQYKGSLVVYFHVMSQI